MQSPSNSLKMNENRAIIVLQKVDSTNTYAADLLKSEKVEEGTVVWAKEQTSGRGQGENRWESEPEKNLTFSWILFPRFLPPDNQFLLTKTIALGVYDFILKFNLKGTATIKWPNDIYVEYNKLGGILINNTISGDTYESAIIGIGLNINQMNFVKEVPNPVSLKQVLGYEISLRSGLESLVNNLEKRYEQLRSGDCEALENDYRKHLLGYQQWRKFLVQNQLFEGKIDGVDESGRLVIISRSNESRVFQHGEIEFLFK
jgi:BirA family transcriptional regulator, biotin operon repressor / biotin---[acetyl-CoA-carboxylase] ligase